MGTGPSKGGSSSRDERQRLQMQEVEDAQLRDLQRRIEKDHNEDYHHVSSTPNRFVDTTMKKQTGSSAMLGVTNPFVTGSSSSFEHHGQNVNGVSRVPSTQSSGQHSTGYSGTTSGGGGGGGGGGTAGTTTLCEDDIDVRSLGDSSDEKELVRCQSIAASRSTTTKMSQNASYTSTTTASSKRM